MRFTRAVAFAAAGAVLGVTAHRLGGGEIPPLAIIAAAFGGLLAVGYAIAGRERGGILIGALVITTQAAMHVGFALCSSMRSAMGETDSSMLGAVLCRHTMGPLSTQQRLTAQATLRRLRVGTHLADPHAAISMSAPSMAAMIGVHLAAAAVLAWWLARGERRVWNSAQRMARTIRAAVVGFPQTAGAARGLVVRSISQRWRSHCMTTCAAGRAPPIRRPVPVLFAT